MNMRGSMREKLWSSMARENIRRVARAWSRAHAHRRAQRDCPNYPPHQHFLNCLLSLLLINIRIVTDQIGSRSILIIIAERFWANTRAIAPSGWRLLSPKTSPPRPYWLYWILVIFKALKPIQIEPIKLDKPDLVWILVYPHQTKVYPIQLHHCMQAGLY
jgi:hypothetical protein